MRRRNRTQIGTARSRRLCCGRQARHGDSVREQFAGGEGIHAALAEITSPVCVASNGPMAKMKHTLGLAHLLDHFEGRIFSAYDVGVWKPDPGLFLHAARTFGAEPSRCIVVEDSLSGIRAANAAGMRVLGYTAGDARAMSELGTECAELFHSMDELPALLS
jgi:beta-phosphoglucomutase-like phosphatase (HAD superfamily)